MRCWVDLGVFGVSFFRGGAGDSLDERLIGSSVGEVVVIILILWTIILK